MRLEWKEYYEMGIEDLDSEHKQLFRVAQKIIDTVDGDNITDERKRTIAIREGVKFFKDYFFLHAAKEEVYMRQIGYPGYLEHKRQHDEFRQIQLQKFEFIILKEEFTEENALDFVGTVVGWLVEHVVTSDLDIVGKGTLTKLKAQSTSGHSLQDMFNLVFSTAFHIPINAKIVDTHYDGAPFGSAVYHEIHYFIGPREIKLLAGLETTLLIALAQTIYGENLTQIDALVLATLEISSANFWKTFSRAFSLDEEYPMEYKSSRVLTEQEFQSEFVEHQPVVSILCQSDYGKFFAATNDPALLGVPPTTGQDPSTRDQAPAAAGQGGAATLPAEPAPSPRKGIIARLFSKREG